MKNINIICVDDQSEVLDSVIRDLRSLEDFFRIEGTESSEDCLSLIDEIDSRGEQVGLVISDHVMPTSGVELLKTIFNDSRFSNTKKILLTGQANHADTIKAINEAGIHSYFEKPWNAEELLNTVKSLLTQYILKTGIDHTEYMPVLDQAVLLEYLRKNA